MSQTFLVKPKKVWRTAQASPESARDLARRVGVPTFVGQVLINRGAHDAEAARTFLSPQLSHLPDPRTLPGIEEAARRIGQAVERRERIVIYGDYDVDGTAAVALLYRLLKLADADVSYYVPSRLEEGYGLNLDAMRLLSDNGTQLVVTVDCGITAIEEASYLAERGIDLVITDHHEGGEGSPRAAVVVDPKVRAPGSVFHDLAGVGVAFNLSWATAQELSGSARVRPEFRDLLVDSLTLVALGTVADVVPLLGVNRTLVTFGLQELAHSRLAGVRALVDASGLAGRKLSADRIAFVLAPRLNAAGRMGDARDSVELFVTDDDDRARKIAALLEGRNSARQKEQKQIFEQALELIRREVAVEAESAIVLAEESWHNGVIGIVASRIVEEFHRPTVVITLEGEEGRGSARSIPEVNLFETLHCVQSLLLSFGGHAQAAGLRIRRDQVGAFRKAFCREVARRVPLEEMRPGLNIDARVELAELGAEAIEALERLEPFGHGNPAPVLAAEGVEVVGVPSRIGAEGKHLAMMLRQGDRAIRGIAFGGGEWLQAVEQSRKIDVAFVATLNTFQGSRSVELRIEDLAIH